MNYPKFIITQDGHLRLGMVTLHKHLLETGEYCRGGGYWKINHLNMQVELSGASSDYGPPQWRSIDAIILPPGYEGYIWVWIEHGKKMPLSSILPLKNT